MLGKKGFTLIELLVVIIIVGILAAISVPMMTSNVERARRTEAVSALGSIRTAQRLYYTEHNAYAENFAALSDYLSATDIDGVYYNGSDVGICSANSTTFTANITGKDGSDAANDWVTITEAGAFGYK